MILKRNNINSISDINLEYENDEFKIKNIMRGLNFSDSVDGNDKFYLDSAKNILYPILWYLIFYYKDTLGDSELLNCVLDLFDSKRFNFIENKSIIRGITKNIGMGREEFVLNMCLQLSLLNMSFHEHINTSFRIHTQMHQSIKMAESIEETMCNIIKNKLN